MFIFYRVWKHDLVSGNKTLYVYVCACVCMCVSVVKIETYMQGITILVTTGERVRWTGLGGASKGTLVGIHNVLYYIIYTNIIM